MTNGRMSNIESKLQKLENITSQLESGNLSIDEAIEAYSQGMEIAMDCKKSLENLKQKVVTNQEKLQRKLSGVEEREESEDVKEDIESKKDKPQENKIEKKEPQEEVEDEVELSELSVDNEDTTDTKDLEECSCVHKTPNEEVKLMLQDDDEDSASDALDNITKSLSESDSTVVSSETKDTGDENLAPEENIANSKKKRVTKKALVDPSLDDDMPY